MDEIDRQILRLLQDNARISNAEISRTVGMAASATLDRLRKLEEQELITGYTAIINPDALGYKTLAFVNVSSKDGCWCNETFEKLALVEEVMECHSIAGEDCFLVKIRARDTRHLNDILRDRIANIGTVTSTRTTIVLETNKETHRLPIVDLEESTT